MNFEPAYLNLFKTGVLAERAEKAFKINKACIKLSEKLFD